MQDIDGDALTAELVPTSNNEPNPAVGTAVVNGNQITLSLPPTFKGVTRVKYRARDPQGALSAPASFVAYVNVAPFKAWYTIGSWDAGDRNVWATDLGDTPIKITNLQPPRIAAGITFSADHQVGVVGEVENNQMRGLWAVNTHPPYNQRLVAPFGAETQSLDRYTVSDDGSAVAYIVTRSDGKKSTFIATTTSTPTLGVPQLVVLPDGDLPYSFAPLQFNKQSTALYFVSRNETNNTSHFYRVPVQDAAHPQRLLPNGNEYAYADNFAIAPDDSYALVQAQIGGLEIYRVSIADPSQRRVVNADLAGDSVGSMAANADATKVVFMSNGADPNSWTDNRVFVSDVAGPRNSTLILDTDPNRSGPISFLQFRPDNNAVLVEPWTSIGPMAWHLDLAELVTSPNDQQLHPVAGTGPSDATYDPSGDVVLYTDSRDGLPTMLEAHRGAFSTPTVLGAPGAFGITQYSSDMSVLAIVQVTSATQSGKIINRSAPEAMISFIDAARYPTMLDVQGLIDD
jgi:hypothetical protein